MPHAQPTGTSGRRNTILFLSLSLLIAAAFAMLAARPLGAQGAPHITGVDPETGRVNDTITVSGENLEKAHVSGVFLSDDKDDHKATVVSQEAGKIVIKVPDVKPGRYNISFQVGPNVFIQPFRFTVE